MKPRCSNPELSIIIVNWNTKPLLERCLDSIAQNPLTGSYEIIVVDNASSDSSSEMVARRFPNVRLVQLKDNLGFAKGNNEGIRLANGKYCLLLNPDTVMLKDALDEMVEYMNSNSEVGVVGANLLDTDLRPCASYGYFPRVLSSAIEFSGLYHHSSILKKIMRPLGMIVANTEPFEVEYVSGAALLIRKSILRELGGLSEDYFAYFEETDLCYRVKRKGWKIVVLPSAKIIHIGGASFEGKIDKRWELLHKGLFTYLRRNRGYLSVLLLKSLLLMLYSAKKAALSFIGILKPKTSDTGNKKKNCGKLIHIVIHEALPDPAAHEHNGK